MHTDATYNRQLLEYFTSDLTGRGEWLAAHTDDGDSIWIYLDRPAPQYMYLRAAGGGWRLTTLDRIANGPAAFVASTFSVQGGEFERQDALGAFRFRDYVPTSPWG